MYYEVEKVQKLMEILQDMARGVNPYSGEDVQTDSILRDVRTTACFDYISLMLDGILKGIAAGQGRHLKFAITPEQKSKVVLPQKKIGVNEFSKCVNLCIDAEHSRRLSAVELNKRLKKLEILSEEQLEDGKTRTITNERSSAYGFEMERRNFKGVEYDMVLMNDIGKKYLLENLENIMSLEL